MRKHILTTLILLAAGIQFASAQMIGIGIGPRMGFGGGFGGGYRRAYPGRKQQKDPNEPKFKPVVHFSIGYGYPNLDKAQLASFYNYYTGTVSQTGPLTGSIDYQYNRNASIGLMVSHGQVNTSYYDFNNPTGPPVMNGSLDNWAVMLNMMNYLPGNETFSPYFRTAIGLNIWDQNYTDASGNKLGLMNNPNELAYQVSIGTTLNLSKNSGLFIEAGYGKYILHAGLTFKL